MSSAKKLSSLEQSREDNFRAFDDLKDRIRSAWPIDQAIERLTSARLISRGKKDIKEACCPFHAEKSPSFTVNILKGNYHCFGSGCGASGDLFQLIMDVQGCDFKSAVIFGAEHVGIEIPAFLKREAERAPSSNAARKVISYPKVSVREAPADLAKDDFIRVPSGVRRPVANRFFEVWENGGWTGDREKKRKSYFPEMVHEYRDTSGALLMCILRIRSRDGKKFFIPVRMGVPDSECPSGLLENIDLGNGRIAWITQGVRPGCLMPVYGAEMAEIWSKNQGDTILIVEGEKTRDAASRLVLGTEDSQRFLTLSPLGGGKSSIYADWDPILEKVSGQTLRVIVWPDADKPILRPDGSLVDRVDIYVQQTLSAFAQRMLDRGMDMTMVEMIAVIPPEVVKSGWDLADAEQDNWDSSRMIQYIEKNSRKIDMSSLVLRQKNPVSEDQGGDVFVQTATDEFDTAWADALVDETNENGQVVHHLGVNAQSSDASPFSDIETETVSIADIVNLDDGIGGNDPVDIDENPVRNNPFFRCLGYNEGVNFFQCKRSGQVYSYMAKQMKKENLIAIAELEWWCEFFPRATQRRGAPANANEGFNMDRAIDALIRASYEAGVWEQSKEVSQGGRIDRGRVVFNTGQKLYVEGIGMMDLDAYKGDYCYTVGPRSRTPDFENAFTANDPSIRKYIDIVSALDWREDTRELAIMAVVGWVAIGPICGILKWRPHLWLDGPYGSGKSWVVTHLIKPILHDYAISVVANSSESGIRNMLAKKSVPVIFDEAEGEDRNNRERMDAVLRMARHSAVASDSVVAQGISGGGAHRSHSVASTFLMTSITAQLEASADASRFAHIHLSKGRDYNSFTRDIATPAEDLLTDEFASRFVARMVMRAGDYVKTYRYMVQALCNMNLERRLADVFGSFATGCWLLMRDGTPMDSVEAAEFIGEEFRVMEQISARNEEIREMKDHHRVFRAIMAAEVNIESRNGGNRKERIGPLIEIAAGHISDDVMISEDEARNTLSKIGIRVSIGEGTCASGQVATHVLIHKNATSLNALLDKTPWARSYADVMLQCGDVKSGKPVRFSAAVGVGRTVIVPLSYFSIGANGA